MADDLTQELSEELAPEAPEAELEVEPVQPELEPEAPSEEPEDTVEINGREIKVSDLTPFVKFADWAQQNPEAWEQLQEVERQGYQGPAEPAATKPQEEAEWEDTDVRLARLEGHFKALEEERSVHSRAEFMASLSDSIEQFKESHPELGEEDVSKVLVRLRDLEILPAFRRRYPARPVSATLAALDTAYRVEYFERAPGRQPVTISEARARRRAASSAPTSASAPREEPLAETKEERDKQMVSEIKEALQS